MSIDYSQAPYSNLIQVLQRCNLHLRGIKVGLAAICLVRPLPLSSAGSDVFPPDLAAAGHKSDT